MRKLYIILLLQCAALTATFSQQNPCIPSPVTAQATGGNMTCNDPVVELVATQYPNIVSYSWTGPNGFEVNKPTAQTVREGSYTLVVTDVNGCTDADIVTVNDVCTTANSDIVPPECPDELITPSEDCWGACVFKCLDGGYFGSNYGYAPDPLNIECFGLNIHNDQWLAFMAPFPNFQFRLNSSNCQTGDGLQMAVYEECGGPPIACQQGMTGGGGTELLMDVTSLIPGKGYYLLIDGFIGDQCDFILTVSPSEILDLFCLQDTSAGCPPGIDCTVWDTLSVSGPSTICPGGTATYGISVPNNALISGYQWTGPEGTLINGNPVPYITYPPFGKKPQITFAGDSGTICVRTLTYFYPPSPPLCIEVGFNQGYETQLPDTSICASTLPYIGPTGEEIYSSGTYVWLLTSSTFCDSVIRQKVKVIQPVMGSIVIFRCPEECISHNGISYCEDDFYIQELISLVGCDSILNVWVKSIQPTATILANTTVLTCSFPTVILSSAPLPNNQPGIAIKKWLNLQTGQESSGNAILVNLPGMYVLTTTVTYTVNGGSPLVCSSSDTIEVTSAPAITLTATATALSACNSTPATITAVSNVANGQYAWTGPTGGIPSGGQPTISVAMPGTYTVKVTNNATGCTQTTSVVVVSDSSPLTLSGNDFTIDCNNPVYIPSGTTNTANPVYTWTVLSDRVYLLTVTDAVTGCTAVDSINIFQNIEPPVFEVSSGTITCAQPQAILQAGSINPLLEYSWLGPGGFSASGTSIMADSSGTYTVVAHDPGNGCSSTEETLVVADLLPPPLEIIQVPPACGDTLATIVAATVGNAQAVYWSSPNGLVDSLAEVMVVPGETYTAHATGPNGCTAMQDFVPAFAPPFPIMTASGDSITCDEPLIILTVQADLPDVSVVWTGPNGFSSTEMNLATDTAGVYTVVVTSTDGCSATATAVVTGDCVVSVADWVNGAGVLRVFPVPSNGLIWLEWDEQLLGETYFADVLDEMGRLLLRKQFNPLTNLESIDLGHLPAGSYLIRVQSAGAVFYGKIILMR